MKRLEFAPKSIDDLEEIDDYIARDNPRRAETFIDEIEEHCRRIAENPLPYACRANLPVGIRSAVHGNYRIFFRLNDKVVRIERILHGTRQLRDLN